MAETQSFRQGAGIEGAVSPRRLSPEDIETIERSIGIIEGEFSVAMGRADRVRAACDDLRKTLTPVLPGNGRQYLERLVPLLGRRSGAVSDSLFTFLLEAVEVSITPHVIVGGLLGTRNRQRLMQVLDVAAKQAERGTLVVDLPLAEAIAARLEGDEALAGERTLHAKVRGLLKHLPLPADDTDEWAGLKAVYLGGAVSHTSEFTPGETGPRPTSKLRRLAARALDASEQPAPADVARAMVGSAAYDFLEPYLAYTRATHEDLLEISPEPGGAPPALASLERVAVEHGEAALRLVLAELGWSRLCLGVEVRPYVGVSIGGAFPLLLSPAEAELFEAYGRAERVFERCLVVGHGGTPADETVQRDDDPVARFRAYNLRHAEALGDILDLSELTHEKVRRILERLELIVHDYVALFSQYSDECAALPRVYGELREKIERELEKAPADRPLSAETTRLVQMFEDPERLADVRTMHGLKRYLHQKGLRLGFRLVESGRATNRTVDLLVTASDRVVCRAKTLEYVDFEPPAHEANTALSGACAEAGRALLPYPVEVVASGFGRQMLHGQAKLPGMRIFCYGNEIHYYASFGNHPAFIRIDYAPPHRGGMIDAEYFGVSKYQLEDHPAPELDNIQIFFRAMEFDASVSQTRIHARYDKERALDMGDLCRKVENLFCLVPYMMEVDWVIGSLDVNDLAFRPVALHWADFLVRYGVLPIDQLLTEDRRGILTGIEPDPAGPREVRWAASDEPYHDRFTVDLPGDFLPWLRGALEERGLGFLSWVGDDLYRVFGQNTLDSLLLVPLRHAMERGEVVVDEDSGSLRAGPSGRFRYEHAARRFAEILASPLGQRLAECVAMAAITRPLERWLRFRTIGTINGYEVQSSQLTLRGRILTLYVVRDADGIIRLAFCVAGDALFCRRESEVAPWADNLCSDVAAFETVLRRNNYLSDAVGSPEVMSAGADGVASVRRRFGMPNPTPVWKTIPGDRRVSGLKASPGRAVGIALFGTAGRTPKDFEGAVLVAPAVRPNEDAFLYRAAAIVSTGGGILSHTGLMALQFKKPALIVSGRWGEDPPGAPVLHYPVLAYEETEAQIGGATVCMRRDFRQREDVLREGDLVVVDADEGTLRVLGQDHDALALYDGLRQLKDIGERLAVATADAEAGGDVLTLRGRRLRALHSLEKLLGRLRDPVLARHAVSELLLPSDPSDLRANRQEKTRLLGILLGGEDAAVAEQSREDVVEMTHRLLDRHATQCAEAIRLLPVSEDLHEILSLRLMVLRMRDTLREVGVSLATCGIQTELLGRDDASRAEDVANERLLDHRKRLADEIASVAGQAGRLGPLRFKLHQILRLDTILNTPARQCAMPDGLRVRLVEEDEASLQRCAAKRIVQPADGGLELLPVIGSKAANLATIGQMLGQDWIPAWFVVTDHALREAMELPLSGRGAEHLGGDGYEMTLGDGIEHVLAKPGLTDTQKAAAIAELWNSTELPEDLVEDVTQAYRQLATGEDADTDVFEDARRPFVAIRSSAREEDTELATRAGEFDTFLFVRGEASLLSYLKRAWSGLWTARAIHNRAVLGVDPLEVGGGVLVQRMVWSRVSGVLQTVNTAEGMLREMVINAGLGLGEGVVSGSVAADQIVVAKGSISEDAPLSIRYITADKTEQVLFDERQGHGTARVETLYHQRLRPAMEYIEIQELVHAAARLEAAYGYPLDIEFGIERAHLRILQARPLATFNAVLQEMIDRYPVLAPEGRNGGMLMDGGTAGGG